MFSDSVEQRNILHFLIFLIRADADVYAVTNNEISVSDEALKSANGGIDHFLVTMCGKRLFRLVNTM